MKTLLNNVATNQTAVRRLRFKHKTVLNGNSCWIDNKQNAPNK